MLRTARIFWNFSDWQDSDKPMPSSFIRRFSDFYRQEFSLNNAEDFAETLSLNEVVLVRVGSFNHCLKSEETTPLEPDLL
jgi:hypothetical protein